MKTLTLATLGQLEELIWFSSVGRKDSEAVEYVDNWEMAIKFCCSTEWENLCLEAANQYRERISELKPESLALWNDIVDDIKLVSVPLVKTKIANIVRDNNLPQSFEDTVQWDILHLALEAEYSDIYPPGFYASQAYWYLNGHFPCGWQGNFPNGKLLIY